MLQLNCYNFIFRQMESKRWSDNNFALRLNGERQSKNSRLKVFYGRGADFIRNRNYVSVTSKIRHDISSWRKVTLAGTCNLLIPSEVCFDLSFKQQQNQ